MSIWLPTKCLMDNIKPFLEDTYGIEIADINLFEKFLEDINRDLEDLQDIGEFINRCLEDYYKTEFYKEDVAEVLDEYEFDNYLGEYSGEEDFID